MIVICGNRDCNCKDNCYHGKLHEYVDGDGGCDCVCDEFYKCIPVLDDEKINELDKILDI